MRSDALDATGDVPTPPVFEEMGDINGALKNVLLLQAQYARGAGGISRQMRDVACESLSHEIARYVESEISRRTTVSASVSSSVPAGEKDWGRATVGLDGSHGFALLGADLQSGEAEFSPIENWPNASYRQERAAWGRALRALEDRLGSGPLRYEVIR